MDVLIWILIIIFFIVSIVGVVVPIIPSVIFIWASFFLYHFALDNEQLPLFFWLMMVGFTIILLIADFFTNRYFVNRFGGSKVGEWGALIGIVIGMFIVPPIGMILVPFLLVLIIELIIQKKLRIAFFASLGALIGFLTGIIAKLFISFLMIITFFIFVFIG